jgi:pyrophosphate--fructose-6-phosphate 1-phosphotransferase
VVGLPKTIDNDVYPIRQSLGAYTAAEHGAIFFGNVVSESSANPRMLILHEVMGRDCGWLTAYTAKTYREKHAELPFVAGFSGACLKANHDIHAVYIPEIHVDIEAEAVRLKQIMDSNDCCNIFLSEGAGVESIVAEMEARGDEVPRDAFGHIKLDQVNPGAWFAKQFASKIGAEKVLVQKSGYYARAAAANAQDRALIKECCTVAVRAALEGVTGCIGHDEDQGDELRPIEFPRIKGGKPFDPSTGWFTELLSDIGQVGVPTYLHARNSPTSMVHDAKSLLVRGRFC